MCEKKGKTKPFFTLTGEETDIWGEKKKGAGESGTCEEQEEALRYP